MSFLRTCRIVGFFYLSFFLFNGVNASELKPFTGPAQLPKLKLEDLYGKPHNIADYRGRVVLVNFWATWCPSCVKEMPSLQKLKEQLAHEQFSILAVNMGESVAEIQRFLNKWRLNLDVLLDENGSAIEDWRVYVFPTSFVLDAEGKIRYGLRGAIEWDSDEVVEQIKELLH